MINLLKKLLGDKRYCRTFHTSYGTSEKNMYHCPKCKITQWRSEFHDFGPM